jgi:hypothetical protein
MAPREGLSTESPEELMMSLQRPVEFANFTETDDSWVQIGGTWTRCVFIGLHNSPDAPLGVVIKGDRDVGDYIAGKRSFNTATMTTVLAGNVLHDGRWMLPGEIYMAPPNDVNGDLLFGPEGGVIFIMFNKRSGMVPKFVDSRDQTNFDKLLRKDVEEVAAGKCEKPLALLPARDFYVKDRAIVYKTVAEVEKYKAQLGPTQWAKHPSKRSV